MSTAGALVVAFVAAGCFGVSAVLQRAGARSLGDDSTRGVGLLGRLMLCPAFAAGVVLDGVAVLGSLVALRTLSVHVVEAILAGSVAIAAVLSSTVLGEALGRRRGVIMLTLVAALAAVTMTAAPSAATALHGPAALAPLALLPLACAGARASHRLPQRWRGFASGALSGIGFGMLALSGHLLPAPGGALDPGDLLFVLTVLPWLCFGIGTFGAGVRDGEVTPVIVGQTLGEAVLPSVAALLLGGEALDASLLVPALAFAAAIAAAVALARAGHANPAARPLLHPIDVAPVAPLLGRGAPTLGFASA